MDRLDALAAFVMIADHGSFAAAARRLRTSPQAITRAIAGLEARLGARLLHRTTRSVRLTDEGSAFVERCRKVLADLAEAEHAVAGEAAAPHGTLVVTASQLFGRMHVLPLVLELLRDHANLAVRLLLVDRNIRLVEEGVDVAVRIGALADSGLHARRVGEVRRVVVASPAYLAAAGAPTKPSDLRHHAIVAPAAPSSSDEWRFGEDERTSVHVKPRLLVTGADAAIAAAEAGIGITRVLSYQVTAKIADGRLVEILKDAAPPARPVHLLFQPTRASNANVRVFLEAALRYFRSARL